MQTDTSPDSFDDGHRDVVVWSITTTTPTEEAAQTIARAAVTEKLAAGAFITGPIKSVFWHLGESGEGQEWRVELRTSTASRDKLAARIKELHPWDNPELTGQPIEWCPDEYAE
ncbi:MULTISPECIES: divalent-cation tolerance protein CutA [Nocardia]|uniref:divalent-cation tolerance protein CutA n=1 Tax=Nocardia abscessus TaxID=120957 RepID=UPI00189402F2|nr:divalent cation tolerance protein CutA [Nocardia abscessus]MBF6473574.1 divalent-cation tolerance protein CutA [Nocardia abscessus]